MQVPRLPQLHTTMSQDSVLTALNEWAEKLARLLTNLRLPDVLGTGERVPGHVDADSVTAEFRASDRDTLVTHSLSRPVRSFMVTQLAGYGQDGARVDGHITITSGTSAPSNIGTYLRAHFDAPITRVTATVLFFGSSRRS